MKTGRFKKRKAPNKKRLIVLLILLIIITYLWLNSDEIVSNLFNTNN